MNLTQTNPAGFCPTDRRVGRALCAAGECGPSVRGRRNIWRHLLQQRGVCDPDAAQLHRRRGWWSNARLCRGFRPYVQNLRFLRRTLGKEWTRIFWSSNIKTHRQVRLFLRGGSQIWWLLLWLLPDVHRGPVGVSGAGERETHRCRHELLDQADGLSHHSGWPGTGELQKGSVWLMWTDFRTKFLGKAWCF